MGGLEVRGSRSKREGRKKIQDDTRRNIYSISMIFKTGCKNRALLYGLS